MIKQEIGVVPQSCGNFDPERPGGYDKAERVFLFNCEWESKEDRNRTPPATLEDGTIVPNYEYWNLASGNPDNYNIGERIDQLSSNVEEISSTVEELTSVKVITNNEIDNLLNS